MNQKLITPTQTTTTCQCTLCYTIRSLCWQQFLKTTTFTSTQTTETIIIFQQLFCHSNYVIYLLECVMCKIQYVENSQTSFNIRLNNHRKDMKISSAVEAYKHFNNNEYTFSEHGRFIIIELLRNINTSFTETLTLRLREREMFWVKKLKTLTLYSSNQELNWYHVMQYP